MGAGEEVEIGTGGLCSNCFEKSVTKILKILMSFGKESL